MAAMSVGIFHHTDDAAVPCGIAADSTGGPVAESKTGGAQGDVFFQCQDVVCKGLCIAVGGMENMKCQPFGGFTSDTRKRGQAVHELYNGFRIIVQGLTSDLEYSCRR